MRCMQCGAEVNKDLVFCPQCGTPLKVTPDYDYIEAEIGSKVGAYLNGENAAAKSEDASGITNTKVPGIADPVEGDSVFASDSVFPPVAPVISEKEAKKLAKAEAKAKAEAAAKEALEERRKQEALLAQKKAEARRKEEEARKKEIEERKSKIVIIAIAIIAICLIFIAVFLIVNSAENKEKEKEAQTTPESFETVTDDITDSSDTTEKTTAEKETTTKKEDLTDEITCSVKEGEVIVIDSQGVEVELSSREGYTIHYTLDGDEPDLGDKEYDGNLIFNPADLGGETLLIKLRAVTFDKANKKAGQLSIDFTVTTREDETAQTDPSESETESTESTGSIDFAAACDSVYTYLFNFNLAVDNQGNAADGSKYQLGNGGTVLIDQREYVIVIVEHVASDGNLIETSYLAVDAQDGHVSKANQTGSGYSLLQ